MAYADVAASQAKASTDQFSNVVNAGTTFNFGGSGSGDKYSNELGQSAKTDASASAALGGAANSSIGSVPMKTWLEIGAIVIIASLVAYKYLHK